MSVSSKTYEPSYREEDVDLTLDDHEQRISRLEKMAYVGIGAALVRGGDIAINLASALL